MRPITFHHSVPCCVSNRCRSSGVKDRSDTHAHSADAVPADARSTTAMRQSVAEFSGGAPPRSLGAWAG
jgi:hypothetical protein